MTPVLGVGVFSPPGWMKGVRVHAEGNSVDATVTAGVPAAAARSLSPRAIKTGHVVVRQELAQFDDSFQPIGMCSPWSVRMKKLHHTLTLIVEGPDEAQIRACIAQSIAAGMLAAIIAAYVTGGAALHAAVSAFLASLEACLGGSYTARIEDSSHWIEWCT